jgi:uncharacterized protein with von Willebrand factor type A (vWA) domain
MSSKEQLIWGVAISVVVLALYGFTRFWPEIKDIDGINFTAQKTQQKIFKNRLKDEPTEDLDQLLEKIKDQEQAMSLTKTNAENILARLAGFDSQELKVRISQLANKSRVRIKSNQVVSNVARPITLQPTAKKKKKSANPALQQDVLLPESSGWLARLSPGTMLHRPMQRLELEGTYQSIQQFIYGLGQLPWQVTVVQLQMQKMPTESPVGYAQLLSAQLVLAL